MAQHLPVDDFGCPIYDRIIAVPKDGDYSRIDPRFHATLKRIRPDMTPTLRLQWLNEMQAVQMQARQHDEARAKLLAMHRSPLLKMTMHQRLDWIHEMMRLRTEWKPAARGDDPPASQSSS